MAGSEHALARAARSVAQVEVAGEGAEELRGVGVRAVHASR